MHHSLLGVCDNYKTWLSKVKESKYKVKFKERIKVFRWKNYCLVVRTGYDDDDVYCSLSKIF